MSNPHGRKSYDDLASEPKKQAERRDLKNRIEQPLRDVHASVIDLIPDGCLPRLLGEPRKEDPNMLNWPFETLKLLVEAAELVKNKELTVKDVKARLSEAMEQYPRDEYIKPAHFKMMSTWADTSQVNRGRGNNGDAHQEEGASTDHSRNHSRAGRRRPSYVPTNVYNFEDDDEEFKSDATTSAIASFPLRKTPREKPDNGTTASTSTAKTASHKRSAPSQGSSSGDDLKHELALEEQKLKVMELKHKLRKKQRQQSET